MSLSVSSPSPVSMLTTDDRARRTSSQLVIATIGERDDDLACRRPRRPGGDAAERDRHRLVEALAVDGDRRRHVVEHLGRTEGGDQDVGAEAEGARPDGLEAGVDVPDPDVDRSGCCRSWPKPRAAGETTTMRLGLTDWTGGLDADPRAAALEEDLDRRLEAAGR